MTRIQDTEYCSNSQASFTVVGGRLMRLGFQPGVFLLPEDWPRDSHILSG
jgi:hypothetical protein